eukprot:13864767-Alexandrium_andersonii.AAC.1
MGGAASPLLWALAYDPTAAALVAVIRVRAPTFVGDVSALTRGPKQTLTSLWFLFAAGHCVGLYIETHTRGWVETERRFRGL